MTEDEIRGFLKLAYTFAAESPDLSTQNGAILLCKGTTLIGSGCNRIVPESCRTPERLERPLKYDWTTHAEVDAILAAIRAGNGDRIPCSTLVCPWLACAKCGQVIVGSGVTEVLRHRIPQHAERPDWAESIKVADEMFKAAGVYVREYAEPLGVTFRFNGQMIEA